MSEKEIPAEVVVAITMALYEIQEQVHDVESNILTIKHPSQTYLPWCDKQQAMTKLPK